MKLRSLVMATACAVAIGGPASAGTGWYLGIGGGYSSQDDLKLQSTSIPTHGPQSQPGR